VQNERLDRFHVKDSMQQAVQDIQGGRILQVRWWLGMQGRA
jgi:hypothetical protein